VNKQGLIYDRPRPVAKSWHEKWSVDALVGHSFARHLTAVPVAVIEIPLAARSYPIVFVKGEDGMTPLALLGLSEGKNLYVNEDGTWTGAYVPAFVRRYPFVLAKDRDNDSFTLCIDEASERCNDEGRGEALFFEGEPSPYLKRMLDLTRDWERARDSTQAFCKRLGALGLLKERRITVRGGDGIAALAGGFQAVDRDALRALDGDALVELMGNGYLEVVMAHLVSLAGIDELARKLKATVGATAEPDGDLAHPVPEA
jgi:hypothetical protein